MAKAPSLTFNDSAAYTRAYLPWRFGAKVRGGSSGPPLLYEAQR